jgi:hypothetical protein
MLVSPLPFAMQTSTLSSVSEESPMSTRVLVCLALSAALPAFAQGASFGPDLEPGGVRQFNVTQAHLQAMQPVEEPRHRSPAPALARLVGKVLSSQVKGLDLELVEEHESNAMGMQEAPGALRLNRRAEICFDNYRVGIKRGGVVMRYELTF